MNKTLKKIGSIVAGVSMLGATLLSASAAADLKDYPSPFITNGKFDGVMVIGAKALPIDNIGVTNIATSLQYVATTPVQGQTDVSVNDGVKIEKIGDDLNYFDTLNDVQSTSLDDTDLPVILSDGEFDDQEGVNDNEVSYTQILDLLPNTGELTFAQPEDKDADTFLWFDEDVNVYNYTLEFDQAVEFSPTATDDDLVGTTLEIQGQTYTITDTDVSSGVLSKLMLLAGETSKWLSQNEPISITSGAKTYAVKLVDVDEHETKCGIDVDGEIQWIDVGQTKEFGALNVGVTDAVAIHEQAQDKDICEVNLGATELLVESRKEISKNGVSVDGSEATLIGTSGEWTGLALTYAPQDDEIFLKKSEAFIDPVLGNFKFLFEGVTATLETVKLETDGSDGAKLTFVNNDGKNVEISAFLNTLNKVQLGSDSDERLLQDGETYADADGVEGTSFLFVTSNGETHVMEIDQVDESESKVDLQDTTYGVSYPDKTYVVNNLSTISCGSLGSVKLTLTGTSSKVTSVTIGNNMACGDVNCIDSDSVLTKNGMSIKLTAGDNLGIKFRENKDGDVSETTFNTSLVYDSTDKDINLLSPDGVTGWVDSKEDSDTEMLATTKGSILTFDSKNEESLVIQHPESDAKGNVFITPLTGEAKTISGGAVIVNKIDVGAVKFDTELSDIKAQNAIVVGGPCVNEAAAELMGNPAVCTEGFESGKAIIKLFENNGKVALLVAGYTGEDTRMASKIVANYDDYDLSGTEVEVTTATQSITKVQ